MTCPKSGPRLLAGAADRSLDPAVGLVEGTLDEVGALHPVRMLAGNRSDGQHEAHTLIRTTLTRSGDIIPDRDTLHIRLDPLSAPRHTAAIDQLCRTLSITNTVYPGTTLTLRYSTKPQHTPITELCQES